MESFDEMVNLLNSCPDKDSLNDSLSEYLSHKKMQESINLKLTNQIINFLNNLIPIISDDFEKNLKKEKKLKYIQNMKIIKLKKRLKIYIKEQNQLKILI